MKNIYDVFNLFWKQIEKQDAKTHLSHITPDGIVEENNFQYIDDSKWQHRLDVYYPENSNNLPVIIDIHGGGWMYGDKELNKNYCLHLASKGYIVFNISYTLVPDCYTDEQLRDIGFALKWIKENISQFPCDDGKIMLTGDSAGGMLALYSACISRSEELQNIFGVVNCGLKFNCLALTHPVAFMNDGIMGAYTKLMWGKDYKNSPYFDYLNCDAVIEKSVVPPTFMVTSSGDFLALAQTRKLFKLFNERGLKAQLMDWPKFKGKDLPHVFSVLEAHKPESQRVINAMLKYYNRFI